MVKHIGIIAVSFEGAALCYRAICKEAMQILGDFFHPEVSMHNHSLSLYMNFIRKNDWNSVANLMVSSARKLAAAGADFAICPDNTVHTAFEKVVSQSPIPLISIIETIAEECRSRKYKKVGILGTKYTVQGPIYRDALSELKIEMAIPNKKDQETVNHIIFSELVPEKATKSTRKELIEVIQRLKQSGCDAVILGCTEIPLIVDSNSPLPTIDSTRLLALKALEHSLGKSPIRP